MDNERLVRAIAALNALIENYDEPILSPTDDVLDQAAVFIWNRAQPRRDEMAVLLWRNGWDVKRACQYANNLDERDFWVKVREMYPQVSA